jgi:uncharacterized protein YndB with AHSA1/START domain
MTISVDAPVGIVFKAFFDADALGAWWQVKRSVTTPRLLGPYAIEWRATEFRDEVLGRLGGVFHGTIMAIEPGHEFFVAEAHWLPPDGDPVGPMALTVTCSAETTADERPRTTVRIRQTGFEESVRWRRYYEIIGIGWERALASLKMLLEK